MCRTTDFHGLQQSRTRENHLQIKSFYVLFTGFRPDNKPVPESLTLVYLPRGHELVIDGSEFRPATKAYLGLHRIVEVGKKEGEGEVMFGSRERVRVNEGVRFEVYLREERLECYGGRGGDDVRVLAVRVAVEGQVAFVETVVTRKRKSKRGCDRLEVIPEGREVVEDESDGKCDCGGMGLYGGDLEEGCGPDCAEVEMELEGIRWAIDVGVWVMCLGVGYMVSRASVKSLRRLRFL
ncbi:NADP-specific glutamate dehydrogenase [Salix suchowensis]|nr:NADP-specific glutamate dehydrogenase [Salix suchowensis]